MPIIIPSEGGLSMIVPEYQDQSECEQLLALLSRYADVQGVGCVLADAAQIKRLLALYSFRTPARAEQLCAEVSSRYRRELLALYGRAAISRRQSESCYLRLEQQLPLLARVALLRLCQSGALSFSPSQLMLSDGMLLAVLEKELKK